MKLKVSEIKNNPNNPRTIKDDKFHKLVQSIKDFPEMLDAREIVVNKDHIILGGNMRFKAAKEAGLKEVPVKIVDWSEEKQREFVIKDNVSGGEWDWNLLANEWDAGELDAWGLDLPDTDTLEPEVKEDEAPEISSEPAVSELGKIYELGRHRVMCGSSTDIDQVQSLLNSSAISLVFTDPPYGISIVSKDGSVGGGTKGKYTAVANDDTTDTARDFYSTCLALSLSNHIIWGGNYFTDFLEPKSCWLVWDKQGGKHVTFADVELAWTSFNKPARMYTHIWDGFRRDSERGEMRVHPTQKPVKLLADILADYSETKDVVYDGFLGSGSTLLACEQTDRTCYGMELDPKYVDVIRKRYHKFVTGSEEGWEDGTKEI